MRKSVATLLCFLVVGISLGQNRSFKLPQDLSKNAYQAGKIVVKVKADLKTPDSYRRQGRTSIQTGIDVIRKELDVLKASNVKKVFQQDAKSLSKKGPSKIDLSNIYFITISPDQNIEEAINLLLLNKHVEYAEPYYNHKLLLEPNDPNSKRNGGTQYQLGLIKAYEAWDVQRGDTNMIIGIIDTGVLPDHQDLKDNIKINYDDPINGVDDDNDGYVDNYKGWDFANTDNDPLADKDPHGTHVAGCSNGRANNGVGVAGTGYNSKFLPLKVFDSNFNLFMGGFEAIKYAADKGCKVINLSWGNDGVYSKYEQDVINYVVLEKDVVVIAAAGNSNKDEKYYPASYDHVLSVGATESKDNKAGFSTYNNWIDICAPGDGVGTTANTGITNYTNAGGTSFSSPIVAGAASLVRLRFPKMNALQVMEQLRVASDDIFNTTENVIYKERLGKGRLNMYKALTDTTSPAVRVASFQYSNGLGQYAFYEDTIRLQCEFKNYLTATNNLKVTLSSTSPYVTILNGVFTPGKLNKLEAKNNNNIPFEFYLAENTPDSQKIVLRLGFEDGNYKDYQYIEFYTTSDYIDAKFNSITLTTTSKGRLGFKNDSKTLGVGLLSDQQQLLGSGGIIFATSSSNVSNNVVTNLKTGLSDQDLTATRDIKYFQGSHANIETRGTLVDSILNTNKIGLVVTHKAYGWKELPDNNYVILEYFVTNKSGSAIPALHAGLFTDWNIGNKNENRASWDSENNFGYTFSTQTDNKMIAVGQITEWTNSYYALDNSADNGNGIVLSNQDGFSKSEKWATLSNGVAKLQSGNEGTGSDVSNVVGTKIDNIENKQSVRIAFAIVVGSTMEELREGINRAREKYNEYQLNPPTSMRIKFCSNSPVDITRPNHNNYKLYSSLPLSSPIYSGNSFETAPLTENKTYYITNEDEGFEGEATKVSLIKNDAVASFSMSTDTLDLLNGNRVNFEDLTADGAKWNWDFDNGYKSTNKNPVKVFTKQGTYQVKLIVENSTGCKDSITKKLVVISTSPKPKASELYICKGETALVHPTNGTNFNFYDAYPLKTPVYSGSNFYLENLEASKTIWITNVDSLLESAPLEFKVNVWDNFADYRLSTDTLNLDESSIVQVSDLAANSMVWTWTQGTETRENVAVTAFSFHKVGVYPITLEVVNSTGCKDLVTKNLVVVRKSPTPHAREYVICENSSVDIVFDAGEKYKYYKVFPGEPLWEGKSYNTGALRDDLTLFVTNSDSLVESSPSEIKITVKDVNADFTLSTDTLNLNEGNQVQFNGVSEEAVKWKWNFGNGKTDTTRDPVSHFYEAGIYPITLITENRIGCVDTTSKVLLILKSDKKFQDLITVYPNPTDRFINLDTKIPGKNLLGLDLLSVHGKVVKSFVNKNKSVGLLNLDVSECNTGLYFLRIITTEGIILKRVILTNKGQ